MEPPRRLPVPSEPERPGRRCMRLPSPRELVAVASVLLVVSNSFVDHSGFLATRQVPIPPAIHAGLDGTQATASRLWELASSRMSEPRGVVLPLFDDIAALGVSLVLELRARQVDLPIEIPHCGDLDEQRLLETLEREKLARNVSVYDVCTAAAAATDAVAPASLREPSRPLFCESLSECHKRFRSFDIKILAVLFSRFQEVLLVDADVLFFQSPASLWTLDKNVSTGTLFFRDRVSGTGKYLSRRVDGANRSRLHEFIEAFDRTPYRHLETISSSVEPTRSTNEPSEYLRATHAWNLLSGHHADSSVLLWNKPRLPRATAILGSFVALRHRYLRPPSYGDKELYFLACEVADAQYTFSHFGSGAIGWDADTDRGVLCGDVLHFFPVNDPTSERTSALYINSDHITSWKPSERTLYRSNARPASHYPGSFGAKNLTQDCPFDILPTELTASELEAFRQRQQFYERLIVRWRNESVQDEDEGAEVATEPPE